jgi:hypothetical protein
MICCIHACILATFIGLTLGVDEPNSVAADASERSVRTIPVMTRNVYFGANLDPVASAPNLLAAFDAAGVAFAQVEATNMPERAAAVAAEIANQRPTLVGLQEVATWLSGPVLNPAPATTIKYDYLSTLLSELAARGLNYQVVASLTVLDAEMPTRVGGVFVQDIRIIQRDVILARGDLPVSELRLSNIQTGYFAAHLELPLGGTGGPVVSFDRGWASVDATVRGQTVRFINTHLINIVPAIQVAQGNELRAGPANTTLPVIVVGDFNSPADGTGTPTYSHFIGAGFTDAWSATHPSDLGNTGFHADDLQNAISNLTQRIDFVLFRGDVSALDAEVVGDELQDRAPSGLWPSDHAGVAARLALHLRPRNAGGN